MCIILKTPPHSHPLVIISERTNKGVDRGGVASLTVFVVVVNKVSC